MNCRRTTIFSIPDIKRFVKSPANAGFYAILRLILAKICQFLPIFLYTLVYTKNVDNSSVQFLANLKQNSLQPL